MSEIRTEDEVTRVMDAVRRIVRGLRVSSKAIERNLGVSGAQLFVLQQLAGTPPLSINELAERTQTHQSSVSAVVSRLAERDLAARAVSEEDARKVLVSLTPAGQALLSASPTAVQARLVAALRHFAPDERLTLAGLLEQWLSEAGLDESPSMFFEDEATEESHG